MTRRRDAGALIADALEKAAPMARVTERVSTRWSSATFNGARHAITLQASTSGALDDWLGALPEADFDLRGHLLADIAVASIRRISDRVTIGIEALTVET